MRKITFAAVAILLGLAARPADAAYTVTLTQNGSDVVATGIGSLDTAGLRRIDTQSHQDPVMNATSAAMLTGTAGSFTLYRAAMTGPGAFGTGGMFTASGGTGAGIGMDLRQGLVAVPTGYEAGSLLMSTAIWKMTDFVRLGLQAGSYEYVIGSGAHRDTFTVNVQAQAVPEPATLALLGTVILGAGLVRRRRSMREG